MSSKKDEILAAIKKLGPSSPTQVANSTGMDPSLAGYHLRAMAKAGTLTATGKTTGRLYAIGDGKAATRSTPQKGKKPPKAPRAKPAEAERFIPAIDSDNRLVLVNGSEPLHFTAPQTEAIAALLLQHFE